MDYRSSFPTRMRDDSRTACCAHTVLRILKSAPASLTEAILYSAGCADAHKLIGGAPPQGPCTADSVRRSVRSRISVLSALYASAARREIGRAYVANAYASTPALPDTAQRAADVLTTAVPYRRYTSRPYRTYPSSMSVNGTKCQLLIRLNCLARWRARGRKIVSK